jgi:hypothetical protein
VKPTTRSVDAAVAHSIAVWLHSPKVSEGYFPMRSARGRGDMMSEWNNDGFESRDGEGRHSNLLPTHFYGVTRYRLRPPACGP